MHELQFELKYSLVKFKIKKQSRLYCFLQIRTVPLNLLFNSVEGNISPLFYTFIVVSILT